MAIEISDKVDLLKHPRVPALKFNARLRGGFARHLGFFRHNLTAWITERKISVTVPAGEVSRKFR